MHAFDDVPRDGKRSEETVLGFMQADHARIHRVLDGLAEAGARGDLGAFATRLALLDRLLRRHIEVEETHLIPIIAARHGQPRGPAAVLRGEHIDVMEVLDELLAESGEGEAADARWLEGRARFLSALLEAHGAKEEELVYGLADRHLTDEERASLLDFCRVLG